jgi:hypothetical protein
VDYDIGHDTVVRIGIVLDVAESREFGPVAIREKSFPTQSKESTDGKREI